MVKLEHGSKYVNRLGEVVTVYDYPSYNYPFCSRDKDGYPITYKSDGHYYGVDDQDDKDLVAEYKESDDNVDMSGYVSKEKLAEYIKNKLAVLETLSNSENEKVSFAATMQGHELVLLADEFGIV